MKIDEHHSKAFSTYSTASPHEVRPMFLQQLGDLARQLAKIATSLNARRHLSSERPAVFASSFSLGLRQIVRGRRIRDRYFPADLFAEPAWDILLDLTVARLEGRQISISSAAIAASVPTATALRWLKILVENGLIERVSDPNDRRRTFIQVTDDAFARMTMFADAFSGRAVSNKVR